MATISEGINWLKTLQQRHQELVRLRDANSTSTTRRWGSTPTDTEVTKPQYDAKKLDRRITLLAREIRLCNDAIKRVNAATQLDRYDIRDEVLGELEDADATPPAATTTARQN